MTKRVPFPPFIYGTAWKEQTTARLTRMAVKAGFRAIDTANQPRHYKEAEVGNALKKLEAEGFPRSSLLLQTKFTPVSGHNHRIPYDSESDLRTQVQQSFESSLKNLRTDRVEAYLQHGPYSFPGLGAEDWEVWAALEEIHRSKRTDMIGISNVNAGQLKALVNKAKIKPEIVQNRCFANQGWDRKVREVCRAHDITYQGFSLLTANLSVLLHPEVVVMAKKHGVNPEQIVFRFALQIGIVPLTGTTNREHMKEDLKVVEIELTSTEVELIESGL